MLFSFCRYCLDFFNCFEVMFLILNVGLFCFSYGLVNVLFFVIMFCEEGLIVDIGSEVYDD